MAVHANLPAALPKELQHFKDRDIRWLWRFLMSKGVQLQSDESLNPSQVIQTIAGLIAGHTNPPEAIQEILNAHRDQIVSESAFRWIDKDDDRLIVWLYLQLERLATNPNNYFQIQPLMAVASTRRRDAIILAIDCWNATPAAKEQFLEQQKLYWGRMRTPDKETKWLNPKDEVQLDWAWTYIVKGYKSSFIPMPVTPKERYAAILIALDRLSEGNAAEKRLFLDTMKKTWSQKKFRDSGKAKKPYHLPLTKSAKDQLDWLATQQGVSQTAILERLIQESFTASGGTSSA